MVLLVTQALTQEEPQLHVQPGAAGGCQHGREEAGDKARLTHCGETGAYFASRKAGVLVRFGVLCIENLLTVRGWGEGKRKRGGAFERFIS